MSSPIILRPIDYDPFKSYGGHILEPDPFTEYRGFRLRPMIEGHIQIGEKFAPLFKPARYKISYGGRAGIKSWQFARALLILGQINPLRVLCGREFMSSIEDSVHKLLKDQIALMDLGYWYNVGKKTIYGANGTEFRFVGLGDMSQAASRTRIKSFEAVDVLWVEEAESISERTWEVTIPTIRKKGSEIWITYNPNLATDATHQRFHPDGGSWPPAGHYVVIESNWRENPWMTDEIRWEKDHAFATDPEAAAHIWDGQLRQHAEAAIFAPSVMPDGTRVPKYVVHAFPTPTKDVRFFHGIDWGFAQDPLCGVRMWTTGQMPTEELWIDAEAWAVGVEIDQMAAFFDARIPTMRKWPIMADNARPELISYMRGLGFNIDAADKWEGCVEDGIAHLRGFTKIHIHERCKHGQDEARLYSFKIDKNNGQVLPIIVDKHNHFWDACIAAGEPISTARGLVPIEQVIIGDSVLTRSGFRKVEQARMTHFRAQLWKLKAGTHRLYATADHRVFTVQRGFERVDRLRYTDYILTESSEGMWQRLQKWFSMARHITSTPEKSITAGAGPYEAESPASTAKSGSSIVDQSQPAITSITSPALRWRRLILAISNVSPLRLIDASMQSTMLRLRLNWRTLKTFAHLLRHGTPAQREGKSIARLEHLPTRGLLPPRSRVSNAGKSSIRGRSATLIASVRTPVSQHSAEPRVSIMRRAFVWSVERALSPIATLRSGLVPARVLAVGAIVRRSSVFDLAIEGSPEFIASGVLVHNCRYALNGYVQRRGDMGVWAALGRQARLGR